MGTSMMKAITYSEFGISTDVLKLKELPIPKPGNGWYKFPALDFASDGLEPENWRETCTSPVPAFGIGSSFNFKTSVDIPNSL